MRSPVETARADEPIGEVARRMRDENIGFVPVCDRAGRVIGVLTDRDLAVRGLAVGSGNGRVPVCDIMTPGVVACAPADEVAHVETLMRQNHLTRLVVLDARGIPVGIVSVSDLARVTDVGETVREISARRVRPVEGDIEEPAVLKALVEVRRDAFTGEHVATASFVALAAAALRLGPGEKALEVGDDPGYCAAVISHLCDEVYSIKGSEPVARAADRALVSLGIDNVRVAIGQPARGLPQRAPFDGIVITGPASDTLPAALLDQLAIEGRMVFPLTNLAGKRNLVRILRKDEYTFQRDVLDEISA